MFLSFILAAIRRHQRHRMDLHHLSQLSDRDLQDIGITRYDITMSHRQER